MLIGGLQFLHARCGLVHQAVPRRSRTEGPFRSIRIGRAIPTLQSDPLNYAVRRSPLPGAAKQPLALETSRVISSMLIEASANPASTTARGIP